MTGPEKPKLWGGVSNIFFSKNVSGLWMVKNIFHVFSYIYAFVKKNVFMKKKQLSYSPYHIFLRKKFLKKRI